MTTQKSQRAVIEGVARTLSSLRPMRDGSLDGVNAHWQWRLSVIAFAHDLAETYPKVFDDATFKRQCGWHDSTGKASKAI